jgi:PhnB protein
MQVNPYLFFEGRCDEAIKFYQGALGAQLLMLTRYKDSPDVPVPGKLPTEMLEKVMHASLRIGDSTVFLSDGHCTGTAAFSGFQLSVTVPSESEADRVFNALADGGKVGMPLAKTFFSPRFGMLTDRFGVRWMVYVQG